MRSLFPCDKGYAHTDVREPLRTLSDDFFAGENAGKNRFSRCESQFLEVPVRCAGRRSFSEKCYRFLEVPYCFAGGTKIPLEG